MLELGVNELINLSVALLSHRGMDIIVKVIVHESWHICEAIKIRENGKVKMFCDVYMLCVLG